MTVAEARMYEDVRILADEARRQTMVAVHAQRWSEHSTIVVGNDNAVALLQHLREPWRCGQARCPVCGKDRP